MTTKKPERLIGIKEVSYRAGISNATIYRWMAAGKFPQARKLAPTCTRWVESEVEAWILNKPDPEDPDAVLPYIQPAKSRTKGR